MTLVVLTHLVITSHNSQGSDMTVPKGVRKVNYRIKIYRLECNSFLRFLLDVQFSIRWYK